METIQENIGIIENKICIICNIEKESNEDNFPYYRGNDNILKFRNVCKICRNKQKQQSKINLGLIKGEDNSFYSNQFLIKANLIHDNKYNYSKVIYNGVRNKVEIICLKHGSFEQRPNAHLLGQGCPNCSISLGENKILKYLLSKDISFKQEKTFDNKFWFDFYIPSLNFCIEYQGEQHYLENNFFSKSLFENKIIDKEKRNFLKQLNIRLLIIPYTKFLKIEVIIDNYLKYING
jgi:hypothetical protein